MDPSLCCLLLCQSCGRAVRAPHLFVLLTSLSQLLYSAVKLVLYCLTLRLQHAHSSKCAIMVLPKRVPCCAQFRTARAAGWHMLQAALLSTGPQTQANGCCLRLALK